MLYTVFTVKDKDYKLRLGAKDAVDLEKKLGTNPINIFMEIAQTQKLPDLEKLIIMLQFAMRKYNHGITIDEAYDIYDEFVDEGHNMMDLVPVLMDAFKASGLIPEEEEEDGAKNVQKVIKK